LHKIVELCPKTFATKLAYKIGILNLAGI
jgi:hypothetical protein